MFDEAIRNEIAEIARENGLPPAALLAVVEVESGGQVSATVRGRKEPVIRFEGHYFDRLLEGDAQLEARELGLASPRAGAVKNPRSQAARWDLLNRAIRINRIAALSSVSWGLGQVMGSHWQWLGYGSVDALVEQARSGVAGQVRLMCRYIDKAGLRKALMAQDWAGFARVYNGPSYRQNQYDRKMARAFKRHSILPDVEDGSGASHLPAVEDADAPNRDSERLMFGSRGVAVRNLQRALTDRGYVLVADGLFGLTTDKVLRRFQRDHFLTETGIYGQKEKALLVQDSSDWLAAPHRAALKTWLVSSKTAQQARRRLLGIRKGLKAGLRKGLLSISRRMA